MKKKEDSGIREVKCCRCGRIYIEQPAHIFKRGEKHFCRWNCYNAYLKEIESKKRGKRR